MVGSSLVVHQATVEVRNTSLGSCSLHLVYIPSPQLTSVSNNSTLSIAKISFRADRATSLLTPLYLIVLYSVASISRESLLSITTSTVELCSVIGGGVGAIVLQLSYSPITLSFNSTLTVANITFGIFNVSTGGTLGVYILAAPSTINLFSGTNLFINNASVEFRNVSVGGASCGLGAANY